MQAIDCQFTKLINGTTQFVIPVFQRDYSWTESQCDQLWRDVLAVASSENESRHFLGSIVYMPTGDSSAGFTRWLLIDGQQRLTTLTLLLIALRDHIREQCWEGSQEGSPTPERIDAYFLKNLQEKGKRFHKLVLRRHDQDTLELLLQAKDASKGDSEALCDSYEFFRDRLQDVDPELVYLGIGRLVVVDVTLDRASDDPQMIFESLNSTGVDLSQADLIRNYILMRLPEEEQTRLYTEFWSKIEGLYRGSERVFDSFARDFVALMTEASKQEKSDQIYRGFRAFFPDWVEEQGSLEAALAKLYRFAQYHAAFTCGSGERAETRTSLSNLRRLVDVPAILVMRLFDCHERVETLSSTEFDEALRLIESFVLRRAISGAQTRNYWQVFARLAYKIQDDAPLDSLKVGLARLRESARFPSDGEFRNDLITRDLYGMRVCRHILERLENHGSKEPTDTSGYSIEHIMPQNERLSGTWQTMLGADFEEVHQMWLHRLGNLTLTGYNSTYSDRPFEEKKTIPGGFMESSVRLNMSVRDQEVWTAIEMRNRGEKLARRALKVWPRLEVDASLIEAEKQRELQEQAAHGDPATVKMSAAARSLFDMTSDQVRALGPDVLELAHSKSVSYHTSDFFLEVLPRKHRLTLLLPLAFHEIEDPGGIAEDATQWKFFYYARYEGGVALNINNDEDLELGLPIIRQAYAMSRS